MVAPAGNRKKIEYALAFGADAVYCGLRDLNLRAGAENFSLEELPDIIDLVHASGKKIYLAVNIFARPEHLQLLKQALPHLAEMSLDGIIVSDPGILNMVHKHLPSIPLHLSTQANTLNAEAAKFWQKNGIKRIIPGRELSLKELRHIRKEFSGELEVFVQGAMCIAYSGRCFMSDYLASRKANEGDCAHPCRWTYTLYEENRPEEPIQVVEDEQGSTFFSSRDLCLLPYLELLISCNIDAVKIEGRMKTIYYLSWVIHAYRQALNQYEKQQTIDTDRYLSWLQRVSHRQYSAGFLLSQSPGQQYERPAYFQDTEFVGEVREKKAGMYVVNIKNQISPGETLRYFTPRADEEIAVQEIKDEKGKRLSKGHSGQTCLLAFSNIFKGEPVLLYRFKKDCQQC